MRTRTEVPVGSSLRPASVLLLVSLLAIQAPLNFVEFPRFFAAPSRSQKVRRLADDPKWIPLNEALPGAPIHAHWSEVARAVRKKVRNPPLVDLETAIDKEYPVNEAFENWHADKNRLGYQIKHKRLMKEQSNLAEERWKVWKNQTWNVTSVFDGPERGFAIKELEGEVYRVFYSNMSWTLKSGAGGPWNYPFDMPQFMYERDYKKLRAEWRRRKRLLRKKHGGYRFPNGRYVHLSKMMDSPFTRALRGYEEKMPWMNSPKEVETNDRRNRALKLVRRLEFEAEERRIARLQELGVQVGDDTWVMRNQPKVSRAGGNKQVKREVPAGFETRVAKLDADA